MNPASAQAADDGDPPGLDEAELAGARLSPEEAARLLALPLPADADAGYALLQSQLRAAQLLEDRPRQIELARQLTVAGRGRPGGEVWVRLYLSAEFNWGSSGRALQASEPFVTDTGLGLGTRATAALRQTYFASQGPDRAVLNRLWTRADALATQAEAQGVAPRHLTIDRLQVRSEIERRDGDLGAAVATLRQAVGLGRRWLDEARQSARGNPQNPALLDAQAWLDGSQGMLVYALVRQGRAAEAIEVAQSNIALWRAGQLSDGLGARWNYRLATGLVATQQYETGLAAARLADEMLQRSGAAATSHTRWLARLELVRSLIGLRRWQEADESYRALVGEMDGDSLARARASDSRLTALLAAKNGRLGEALETAERSHRYRLRLYGKSHPLTQEAAGVRAVVRLLRGDVGGAMSDYEELFAATLDNPGGWLDLDLRGLRGFVLGIAFGEFMNHVAERALRGEGLEPALAARALQIADRSKLGATQRALADSTARVLAATPALRGLLEQEQMQRQLASGLFGKLSTSLGQEDRLRRELASEAFKALPTAERTPRQEELRALREQIKSQQAAAAAARASLHAQREEIARRYPAYADLVTPPTPRPEQLRGLLEAGEGLLVIHALDKATLIWLISADGGQGLHASTLTGAALAQRVAELRSQLDLGEVPAGREPALPQAGLHALYRELLEPLAPRLQGLRSLIVATDGPLASLPLATLLTQAPQPGVAPAWLLAPAGRDPAAGGIGAAGAASGRAGGAGAQALAGLWRPPVRSERGAAAGRGRQPLDRRAAEAQRHPLRRRAGLSLCRGAAAARDPRRAAGGGGRAGRRCPGRSAPGRGGDAALGAGDAAAGSPGARLCHPWADARRVAGHFQTGAGDGRHRRRHRVAAAGARRCAGPAPECAMGAAVGLQHGRRRDRRWRDVRPGARLLLRRRPLGAGHALGGGIGLGGGPERRHFRGQDGVAGRGVAPGPAGHAGRTPGRGALEPSLLLGALCLVRRPAALSGLSESTPGPSMGRTGHLGERTWDGDTSRRCC
ncbi:hypothetical protein PEC18_13250 [Paucibacter sp. O1-1]|nr:hypothetical protein [Paucibacter sp. O1-1]MDA3826786.1 hypothetical protein [Paucibacter sp. O1-1]